MPYSIQTKDGIKINNIPDDVAPDSDALKQRVAQIRASNQPSVTDGVSSTELGLAGAGKAITDTGRGLQQVVAEGTGGLKKIADSSPAMSRIAGALPIVRDINRVASMAGVNTPEYAQRVQQDIDEARRLDQPLMDTTSGKVGYGLGAVASAAPTAFIPGVNTYKGAAMVGGAMGALAPVESGADRLKNAATGAAFGVAGQAVGKALGAGAQKLMDSVKSMRAGTGVVANAADDVARSADVPDSLLPEQPKADNWLFRFKSPMRDAIKQRIEAGQFDRSTAQYVVDGAGKIAKDPVAKEAIKQGYDDGLVAMIKGSSKTDRAAMNRMLSTLEKGKQDLRFSALNRPADVAGDSLAKRYNQIRTLNKSAAAKLDAVAEKLKGQQFNSGGIGDDFINGLEKELGVKVAPDGKLDFSESIIDGTDEATRFITKIYNKMRSMRDIDAYKAHQFKRFIDEQVNWEKSGSGLTGKTEGFVKGLRTKVDQALDSAFPEYNAVNTQYSDTINAMNDFGDVAGRFFDIKSANADKQLGTLSRRLMSNVQSRAALLDSITQLEQVAGKYGVKFDDDIITQAMFADELDRIFGAAAKTSLQGDAQKAGERAARLAMGREGVADVAISAIGKGVEKARGINEKNAIKVMRQLLNRP